MIRCFGRKKGAYGQALSADERQCQDWVEEKSGRANEISLVIYQERASVVSLPQSLSSWDRAAWLNTEELSTVKLSHKHTRTHECFCWLLCIFYSAQRINRHSRIMMGWHLLCHCVLNVEYWKVSVVRWPYLFLFFCFILHLYSATSKLVLRCRGPKQDPTLGGVSTEGICRWSFLVDVWGSSKL